MGKTIDAKIKNHVKKILLDSNAKPKEISKWAILADKFYKDNKESFDLSNVPYVARKTMMSNFILFMVQFETVCIRAYKLSGSGSTADDIIHLYSSKERLKHLDNKTELLHNAKSFKICNSPLSNSCSNVGNFKDYICNECKSELDCFHDVIFNANGKDLNYKGLSEEFIKLPEEMKVLSEKWGLCDTVFRDKVFDMYNKSNSN